MRVVLQRVKTGAVYVEGQLINEIHSGYVLLIGMTAGDTEQTVEKVANKLLGLRIWDDSDGKMNLALDKNSQEILAISQFTLYANIKKGKRPSFVEALEPIEANKLYEYFCKYCNTQGYQIKKGVFGAMMDIHLINDGPVTIIIDSDTL